MVGLFGGSFDPVHHGHLIVGQVAAETLGLESLRLVPAREQPFKRGRHGASAAHRVAMLDLAVAGVRGLEVERVELGRPGPSYTVDTLRAIHAREPGVRLTLLLGADAAAELEAWREPDEIPRLATVVVFARHGASVPASPLITRTIEVPAIEISATEVRRRVKQGRSLRYWVPDPVAEYVIRHRLYLDPA
ncbi:MAG: nicotinate-nucleotide adenylyltransferase [Gemmatimonadales bacterium]